MPPKADKNASKGAKKAVKKWSHGKTHDPLKNAVMFDKETLDKLNNDVPKYKLITPTVISDRLKISVSLAAKGLNELARQRKIKLVSASSKHRIYTRAAVEEKPTEEAPAAKEAKKGGKKEKVEAPKE